MARALDVYLEQKIVGQLIQDDDGQMSFAYDSEWLSSSNSIPLSCSLPLQPESFTQKQCKGFFGGILPEETNRQVIARILQISDQNDFALLERLGGECAGALTFLPEGERPPDTSAQYRALSDSELSDILEILPTRPLLAGEGGVRLSLAGAQDKIAVRVDGDGSLSLPLNYAPSTHILKPAIATWEGLVANEHYCMTLARAAGLNAAFTSADRAGEIEYLLSERFDRYYDENGNIHRLHQEDFCQALGVPSEIKYQSEGGPGLKECFDLLRATSSSAVNDLRDLLNAVIFNLLIGNNDAHAKNYSIIYGRDGRARLAPLYDLICTIYYPEIENRLAMKIGGEATPELIYPEQIETFAGDASLGAALVRQRVAALAEQVRDTVGEIEQRNGTTERIAELIIARCERVLAIFG